MSTPHIYKMLYTFKNPAGRECAFDMEDKRFRIKPYQQMLSSCSGALLCSLLSKSFLRENRIISITDTISFAVTPLDVAKTRLQAQQKRLALNTSFINCPNGEQLLRTHSTHYSGMIVRTVCILWNRISFLLAFKFNMKSLAYGEFFVMFTKRD